MSGYTSPFCEKQISASFDAMNHSSVGYSFGSPIRSFSFQFNVKTGYKEGVMVYSGILVSQDRVVHKAKATGAPIG